MGNFGEADLRLVIRSPALDMLSLRRCWTFKLSCPEGTCIHGSGAQEKVQDGKIWAQRVVWLWSLEGDVKCLPPYCRLGQHHPQWETVLICAPKSWWIRPAELASVIGTAGCHQLEPAVFFSNEVRIGNSGRD